MLYLVLHSENCLKKALFAENATYPVASSVIDPIAQECNSTIINKDNNKV
jgi:hypothetical protein